eukprot:7328022-Prymnesium_polylepis.3
MYLVRDVVGDALVGPLVRVGRRQDRAGVRTLRACGANGAGAKGGASARARNVLRAGKGPPTHVLPHRRAAHDVPAHIHHERPYVRLEERVVAERVVGVLVVKERGAHACSPTASRKCGCALDRT